MTLLRARMKACAGFQNMSPKVQVSRWALLPENLESKMSNCNAWNEMGYKWSQLNSTRRSDAVKLFWWNTVCADSCSYRNHCTTLTQSCAKASALAKRSHFNMMSHCSCQIGTMISYIINYHCLLALPSGHFRSIPPGPHTLVSIRETKHRQWWHPLSSPRQDPL